MSKPFISFCQFYCTVYGSLVDFSADTKVGYRTSYGKCTPRQVPCQNTNSEKDRVVTLLADGLQVMCDTKTDGGGWIIFQRRISGNVSFYRGWEDYKYGFGDYDVEEFYLGKEYIFQLTNRRKHQLRIDLEFNKTRYFAQYSLFRLLGENENYRLKIDGYSGNATDNLIKEHANMMFSTFDKDNDRRSSSNCAKSLRGAWWYNACYYSNLNGVWGSSTQWEGVIWLYLTGYSASATFTEMKIRETEH